MIVRRPRAVDPNDEKAARAYVFRLIKIRERSEQELRDKLALRGFSRQAEDAVLAFCRRAGLVDDALFARLWVASRIRRPMGVRRLRWELRRKGIAAPVIEEALSAAAQGVDEKKMVRAFVRAKRNKFKGLTREKIRQRLYSALARRGYAPEMIFEVLLQELPDHETSDDA
jgi:regulatory protein